MNGMKVMTGWSIWAAIPGAIGIRVGFLLLDRTGWGLGRGTMLASPSPRSVVGMVCLGVGL